MKLRLLPIVVVALCSIASAGELRWKKTYESALAEAKSSNKLIMIDFYTDWCGWCKKLDKDTYTSDKVVKVADRVIAVKVDAEKEGKDLAKKYGVTGYPTILFLDKSGNVHGKIGGYEGPSAFSHDIVKYSSTFQDYPVLVKTLKTKPNDGEANARMAAVSGWRNDAKGAEEYLAKAQAAKYKGPWLSRALSSIGDIYQTANQLDKAIRFFQEADSMTTDTFDRSYAKISLIYCYQAKQDAQSMKKACEALIAMPGAEPEWVADAKAMLKGG